MSMDVIDFEIRGAEMQFVEVELDPGEAAIGEAGSMMFMDAGKMLEDAPPAEFFTAPKEPRAQAFLKQVL